MPLGLSAELKKLVMISEAVNGLAFLCPRDSAAAVGQPRVLEPRDNCHKRKRLVARTVSEIQECVLPPLGPNYQI